MKISEDENLYRDYARMAHELRTVERKLRSADYKWRFLSQRCPFYEKGRCSELNEECHAQCHDGRFYRFEDNRLVRL